MDKNKVIEAASKLIAKGAFDKAIKEYQRVLEVDPDDVRVLQKLAELYQKMKRQAEAADCFEKVAKTYAAQGFYLKAVALYKQVLKVIDRVEVNVRLAELYQQLGLVGDATKEWQTVAAYYEKTGDAKSSLDTLRKLVDLDPDNVAARIRLGEQYARQDQLVEAVTELRRAATYLQRNGRQDDYLRVAERISHLDQGDVALAKELAESYLGRGDSKRALAKLQICFKANPRDLTTLQMLAKAFQELGQVSKTVSVLKELARVHLDAGRGEDANRTYQQAHDLAPEDADLKASLRALEEGQKPAPRPAPPVPASQPARPAARPPPPPPRSEPTQEAVKISAPPPAAPRSPAPFAPPEPVSVPPNPAAVTKLLKETEVYVKYGLHEKALEHLRKIFSADPENLEAHEKAKAVALSTNRPDDAAVSLATLVRLYTQKGDARAEGARAELKQLDPGNLALQSGALPKASLASAAAPAAQASPASPASGEDEMAVEVVPEELEGEDQFFDGSVVEEGEAEADGVTNAEEVGDFGVEEVAGSDDGAARDTMPIPASPGEVAQAEPEDSFASDLAEADFYVQAGLVEDARNILEAILLAEPDHPEAARRLADIGASSRPPPPARAAAAISAAAREPRPQAFEGDDEDSETTTLEARPVVTQSMAAASRDHDDLAAELAAELAEEVGAQPTEDGPLDDDVLDPFQVTAQEVLGEFRAKVQETVRPEDVQTHYDLGIAYKEMGLLEEAMAEFSLALQHGGGLRAVDCLSMLGSCELDRGNPEAAVKQFQTALGVEGISSETRRALAFELGSAYETLGYSAEALQEYQLVDRQDSSYRDVQARLTRLGGTSSRPPPSRGQTGPRSAARPGLAQQPPAPGASRPPSPGTSRPPAPSAAAPSAPPPVTAKNAPAQARPAQGPRAPAPPAEPEPAAPGEPSPGPLEPSRRNRKIGFV